jgi:hypothetical protein
VETQVRQSNTANGGSPLATTARASVAAAGFDGSGPLESGSDGTGKKRRIWPWIVAVCILLLALLAAWWFLIYQPSLAKDDWYDGGMTIGSYEGKSQEDIEAALNAQVKEGEMNITCAPVINVDSSTRQADIRMENIEANHVDQKFTITSEDGTVLYQSGAVSPGNHIQTVTLDSVPSAGTHNVTVTFQGYDRDTHKAKGGTAAFSVQLVVG